MPFTTMTDAPVRMFASAVMSNELPIFDSALLVYRDLKTGVMTKLAGGAVPTPVDADYLEVEHFKAGNQYLEGKEVAGVMTVTAIKTVASVDETGKPTFL